MEMPEAPDKWYCTDCSNTCNDRLAAPHPFDTESEIYGCPHCLGVDLTRACQVHECDKPASSGHPRAYGFRYICTCWEHSPANPKMALRAVEAQK